FFFPAEYGIRDFHVTGVQTCALPISPRVFISGGIGQTPLLAMLEDLLKRTPSVDRPIVWVHGCRNEQVHAFRDRLRELRQVGQEIGRASCRERAGRLAVGATADSTGA